jgi:hypothetical protein
MKFRRIVSFLAAGAASLSLATPAMAQTTGGLQGQIIDASTQQPVAEAVVIATSPALQGEQTAVTDASGSFEISLLPAGVYKLDIQREGYKPYTQADLTVRLDKTIKIKLQLLPDSISGEQMVIEVQRPVISTTTTDTGGNVSKEQMALIPYGRNARTFDAVLTTVPGAHGDAFGVSFNGSGSPESNYVVDGVQVNDPAFGIQGTTLIQDFVQEVDVKSGGYQAEYGRSSGALVEVITKSGGNDFHGSVFVNWSPFEANRKTVSLAGQAIASQASQNYNLDFGAEVGGPIIKDKLWFFAGFAPSIVSTNLDRIIQAQQDNGSGGAKVDSNGTPITTEIARQRYVGSTTSYQFTGKLTYLLNENHTVALAVYGNPTKSTGTQGVGRFNEGLGAFEQTVGSTDVSLRYAGKLFSKQMLVEATAAYHRQGGSGASPTITVGDFAGQTAAQRLDTPSVSYRTTTSLLNPLFDDGTVPSSQKSAAVLAGCTVHADGFNPCPVTNYSTGGLGYLATIGLDRIQASLKLTNFIPELAGHHQIKYGADIGKDTFNQDKTYTGGQAFYGRFSGSQLTYFQGVRGFGHADPSHPGLPEFNANATAASGGGSIISLAGSTATTNTNNFTYSAFIQDSWNILDKGLVLDIGGRIEYQKLSPDSATAGAQSLSLTNIMPRIGLTYDWTGRGLSKVYASYGQFYEYVPLDLADRALSGETQATYSTTAAGCTNPKDPRTCPLFVGGQPGGRTYRFTGGGAGDGLDPNLKGQYVNEYQLGTEYQVYRDISLGLSYVRKSLGRVIEDMSVDDGNSYFLSNPGETCSSSSIAAGACGQYGVTGLGQVIAEPPPRRVYDGVTFQFNKQYSDNWLLSASYTWSSFRGNYPGLANNTTGQLDPNILSEYDLLSLLPNKDGPLPGDIPNSFKIDGAYVFEINSNMTLNIGGNVRIDQGSPLNYLGAHPLYGSGEAYILPRGTDGRLPWTWNLNLRGQVNYKLTKDYILGVTLDMFNVTDNRQTTSVDQNYTFDSIQPIVNGSTKDLAYLKNTAGSPVALNPTFNNSTSYQLPFSARIGAKLSF